MSSHDQKSGIRKIACFISPHGFGHAARACAVMAAMLEMDPLLRFEIFTKVPSWFFSDSLTKDFGYHSLLTDIGLVQKDPLHEDIDKTILSLNRFLPFDEKVINDSARLMNELECRLVICDIAPMGIEVARKADIPSVLIENFTWDWIYEGYSIGKLDKHSAYLRSVFDSADYHIQTEPVCSKREGVLTTLPVSRKTTESVSDIRYRLGISAGQKAVLITMGGIRAKIDFAGRMAAKKEVCFIIPGGSSRLETTGNIILLPHHTDIFHPDLVNSCDAVVGKVGYGLLSEVYHAGVPFGYISRPHFRESGKLAGFIEMNMPGLPVEDSQFQNGKWLDLLDELLSLPRIKRREPNGAIEAAGFIGGLS